MSHALTRRIARTALLTAAGAATVVGAAGAASAVNLPASPVGGLSTDLDGENVGNTLDRASRETTEVAGRVGGKAVEKGVPAAGKVLGTTGKAAAPAAQSLANDPTGEATGLVGEAAGKALPTLGGLPIGR
ncbi:ATP-binding protein [Streptomyces albus subsp. chlorinus]|uniref:ATP-binding protein n=1 Tax=Streptomyces albus TaxID=1888 RepID=UPI00156D8CA0|nr:ATP-binding protein [Streptomyces albus]NSC23720.1 ATP-binding protein [Streptomyces albus subsp. chlorinus]